MKPIFIGIPTYNRPDKCELLVQQLIGAVADLKNVSILVIENYKDCVDETIEVGKGCVINLQSVVEKLASMVKHYKPNISGELKFSNNIGGQILSSYADTKNLRKLGWEATTPIDIGPDKMIIDKLDGQF